MRDFLNCCIIPFGKLVCEVPSLLSEGCFLHWKRVIEWSLVKNHIEFERGSKLTGTTVWRPADLPLHSPGWVRVIEGLEQTAPASSHGTYLCIPQGGRGLLKDQNKQLLLAHLPLHSPGWARVNEGSEQTAPASSLTSAFPRVGEG